MSGFESGSARGGAGAPLLDVEGLQVCFVSHDDGREVRALTGVDLQVQPGETVGVLGESGCGKSTVAKAILGGLDRSAGAHVSGAIRYRGRDLLTMAPGERRPLRGREIALVTQDALAALNPVRRIGDQMAELPMLHLGHSRARARRDSLDLLAAVGIPDPDVRMRQYPHQLSGGMRQRVVIAMAISLKPRLLIADEPTTALDVTVQAEILSVFNQLVADHDVALVFITHDLPVLADVVERVAVMYAGRVVEQGRIDDVVRRPAHPYTQGLISSIPRGRFTEVPIVPIPGSPPALEHLPPGCAFRPRCPMAIAACAEDPPPPAVEPEPGRLSACHRTAELLAGGLS